MKSRVDRGNKSYYFDKVKKKFIQLIRNGKVARGKINEQERI